MTYEQARARAADLDDERGGGGAAGKRALTDGLGPRATGGVGPPVLYAGPAGAGADAFDFSFGREKKTIEANDQATMAEVRRIIAGGERNEYRIADEVFWKLHPELTRGDAKARLRFGDEYQMLLDLFVLPALAAMPVSTPVPPAPPPPGAEGSYRTQNDNQEQPWGSCNTTSLTMALMDLVGGDEGVVKAKTVEALRKLGHAPPSPLAGVQTEDLLTRLAQLKGWDVLASETLLNLAKLVGIASGGAAGITGYLKDKATRDRARDALQRGEKILLGVMGGPGHYVTLLAVHDHGIIVHDPAGTRCEFGEPFFLSTNKRTADIVRGWMWLLTRAGWPAAARRRLTYNAAALEVVEQLITAMRAAPKEQAAIIGKLATGENLELGANNYYDLGDIAHYQIDIRVEMHR